MANKLTRYQQTGDFHCVTFSCYRRKAHLGSPGARDLFEQSLETIRRRYHLFVFGYVVMPEHVHLLVSRNRGDRITLDRLEKRTFRRSFVNPTLRKTGQG